MKPLDASDARVADLVMAQFVEPLEPDIGLPRQLTTGEGCRLEEPVSSIEQSVHAPILVFFYTLCK